MSSYAHTCGYNEEQVCFHSTLSLCNAEAKGLQSNSLRLCYKARNCGGGGDLLRMADFMYVVKPEQPGVSTIKLGGSHGVRSLLPVVGWNRWPSGFVDWDKHSAMGPTLPTYHQ